MIFRRIGSIGVAAIRIHRQRAIDRIDRFTCCRCLGISTLVGISELSDFPAAGLIIGQQITTGGFATLGQGFGAIVLCIHRRGQVRAIQGHIFPVLNSDAQRLEGPLSTRIGQRIGIIGDEVLNFAQFRNNRWVFQVRRRVTDGQCIRAGAAIITLTHAAFTHGEDTTVIAAACMDIINARAAINGIVTLAAPQHVIALIAIQLIIAFFAVDRVVIGADIDGLTAAGFDQILIPDDYTIGE